MNKARDSLGLVLTCDVQGNVLNVWRDDLGLGELFPVGRPLALALDRGSLGKALSFLDAIRGGHVILDWQMAITRREGVFVLNFVGAGEGEVLLISAARTRHEAVALLEDYALEAGIDWGSVHKEMEKELARVGFENEKDSALFDELGRLNNELINLQRELARKNAELARLNDQKNHFLGIAAHDLRNPLNAIQMYSEFLLDEVSEALDAEHVEFISIIHSSSQFMLRLVNDLLDVAKIESGKLYLDLEPRDLGSLLEHNVQVNKALAARKGIALRLELEASPLFADVDQPKIEQVLNNLITNAVKFSNPETTVTLSLRLEGDQALIMVSDEGLGIPPQELDNLFKPFHRTSVRPTGDEQSTGLGLAIAQRIVQGHKGEISVTSEVGKGTCFIVSLPLSPAIGRKE